jgi:hypothetical protein
MKSLQCLQMLVLSDHDMLLTLFVGSCYKCPIDVHVVGRGNMRDD